MSDMRQFWFLSTVCPGLVIFSRSVRLLNPFYAGYVDSAITKQRHDCKEFLLRDDRKEAVKCLFYEVVSVQRKVQNFLLKKFVIHWWQYESQADSFASEAFLKWPMSLLQRIINSTTHIWQWIFTCNVFFDILCKKVRIYFFSLYCLTFFQRYLDIKFYCFQDRQLPKLTRGQRLRWVVQGLILVLSCILSIRWLGNVSCDRICRVVIFTVSLFLSHLL